MPLLIVTLVTPLALMTLLLMVGEEESLTTPMFSNVPPKALAVTFVIVGEEE
jgi:hypothetical protein